MLIIVSPPRLAPLDAELPATPLSIGAIIYPASEYNKPKSIDQENMHNKLKGLGFIGEFENGNISTFKQLNILIRDFPEEYTHQRLSGIWYCKWLIRCKKIRIACNNLIANIDLDDTVLFEALRVNSDELSLFVMDHMAEPIVTDQNVIRWACANSSYLVICRLIQRGYVADEMCYPYVLSRKNEGFHTRRSICELLFSVHNVPLTENIYIESLRYSTDEMYFLWTWATHRNAPHTSVMVDACIIKNGAKMLPALVKNKFPINDCKWILFDLPTYIRINSAMEINKLYGGMPIGSLDMAIRACDIHLCIYLRSCGHGINNAGEVLATFIKLYHNNIPAIRTARSRLDIVKWTITEFHKDLALVISKVIPQIFDKLYYDTELEYHYEWLAANFLPYVIQTDKMLPAILPHIEISYQAIRTVDKNIDPSQLYQISQDVVPSGNSDNEPTTTQDNNEPTTTQDNNEDNDKSDDEEEEYQNTFKEPIHDEDELDSSYSTTSPDRKKQKIKHSNTNYVDFCNGHPSIELFPQLTHDSLI